MAISNAVRRYYAHHIFAQSDRTQAPPNFRPRDEEPGGRFAVEACRGGGKNILEVRVWLADDAVADVRVSCGLCNPAMYVAADILADWARGRPVAEILGLVATDSQALRPFFERLGGHGRPSDAREKFQYALAAVQNAVRDGRGLAPVAVPEFPEPVAGDDDPA